MRLSKSTAASALIAAMAAVCLVASSAPAQAANPSYLFTVQAVAGSTVLGQTSKGEDERFTLTMRGVDPVTKFADRPLRAASVISPAALVSNWDSWFADSPPNAVLTFAGRAGEAPQSIVVTLTKPRYERAGHTLTFTASRTYRTVEPSEKGKGWKRPATPRTFTSVSLFIDDAGDSQTGALTAQLQQAMQQYVFQPNNSSTWAAVASAMSSILTTAWQQGSLMGPTAASAFTVNCQPSAQQILNGYLSCAVSMQLASGENYTTTLTQMMATSG
jgi:hypothetical protein